MTLIVTIPHYMRNFNLCVAERTADYVDFRYIKRKGLGLPRDCKIWPRNVTNTQYESAGNFPLRKFMFCLPFLLFLCTILFKSYFSQLLTSFFAVP